MKTFGLFVLLAMIASVATAQNPPVQPPVQMQCRRLVEGEAIFLMPNERLINGVACHPVTQPATASAAPPKPAPAPANAPAPVASPTPATIVPSGPLSTKIMPGASVYIEPMNGFGPYLTAAIAKEKVQLVPVVSVDLAEYVIGGTSEEKKSGWPKTIFTGETHSQDAASVSMVDRKTGAIVFAYAFEKKNSAHANQTTAEACAKQLQARIEGKE
jgi:hypothetical protein